MPHARARLEACEAGDVVTSAVVFAEVLIGLQRLGATEEGTALFSLLPVLPFNEDAVRIYATLPFRRGSFDRLIAAHAIALDLTVVTANIRDFADLSRLRVEDWTQPA